MMKMKQDNKNISLVVVNAVSPDIEEYPEVALPNIQAVVDRCITSNIYEFFVGSSELKHSGKKLGANYRRHGELSTLLSETVPGEIILAGGSLGNKHYDVFTALLEAIKAKGHASGIHIPFDCIYSFESKYDSGESWEEGKLANKKMPVFDNYRAALKTSDLSYSIVYGGRISEVLPLATLHIWDEWKQMADYLQDLP